MATCLRCGKDLIDAMSVKRGYGPICWKRVQRQMKQEEAAWIGEGVYDGGDIVLTRTENGIRTNVPRRLVRHSPSGFEWGYLGSGPADLSLNILLLFTSEEAADALYQTFKSEFVANVPREGGVIKKEEIIAWLREHGAPVLRE